MDRYSPFSAFLTFFDGSFSVIQPKAPSAYKNIAFETFELSNEKISRQKVKTDLFPLYSPKHPCQYTHIGGETFEVYNAFKILTFNIKPLGSGAK